MLGDRKVRHGPGRGGIRLPPRRVRRARYRRAIGRQAAGIIVGLDAVTIGHGGDESDAGIVVRERPYGHRSCGNIGPGPRNVAHTDKGTGAAPLRPFNVEPGLDV